MAKTEESKRFEQFRKFINLSQQELAEVLTKELNTPFEQSKVSKYSRGIYAVPLEVLKVLHVKYQLSYEWFFHGTGRMLVREVKKQMLVTETAAIRNSYELLEKLVASLRADLNKVYKDFYEYKNTHP